MNDLQDSVLYISNTVPRMENSSIQTRTTSLKLFTNLTNQTKYVTKQNNTSGADRTVNDVFKS